MKTQNIMASSYRLKVSSTQNKGVPFFSCLNHGVYYYTSMSRLFSYKNFSQIPCKIYATQCFFTDHLKHKTVNIMTCRTPSADPRQLCAH